MQVGQDEIRQAMSSGENLRGKGPWDEVSRGGQEGSQFFGGHELPLSRPAGVGGSGGGQTNSNSLAWGVGDASSGGGADSGAWEGEPSAVSWQTAFRAGGVFYK